MVRIKLNDLRKYPNGMGTILDTDGTEYRAVEV